MRTIDIWRVKDGMFVEQWDELNTLEMVQPPARRFKTARRPPDILIRLSRSGFRTDGPLSA